MNPELKIVETADGSNTIYNAQVGENYHSKNGALQESRHVFLNSGLIYFLENSPATNNVSVLEVGFGTGLNFLLTAGFCTENGINLNYTGIEAYPLSDKMISETGYEQYVAAPVWDNFIKKYPDSLTSEVELNHQCKLQVANCKLEDFNTDKRFDIIYFDAFAVAHQPEMWDEDAISHTIRFLKLGGVFVTYAITGNLKRTLKALDCKIEKVQGAAGKREMMRAVKIS